MANQLTHAGPREMRATRRVAIRLIDIFINKASQESMDARRIIVSQVLPPLLVCVYGEYRNALPDLRDPEVLNLAGSLIIKLNAEILPEFASMFIPIFEPSLDMIKGDFDSYSEIRVAFFHLLQSCVQHCYLSLIALPFEVVRNVMAALIFGIQDEKPDIAGSALKTLLDLLRKTKETKGEIYAAFAKDYFMILQQTIGVMTDTLHTAGYRDQCLVLQELTKWGNDPALAATDPNLQKTVIMQSVGRSLLEAFPHLTPSQVEEFVVNIFNPEASLAEFSQFVKDFTIQLKVMKCWSYGLQPGFGFRRLESKVVLSIHPEPMSCFPWLDKL
eukprot:Protomagalhaensia_sp_Gyna_25__6117@NODE_992_length_2320_cov_21_295046_g790_i0_p1_GENE_NODE_992_length_2320_cov_21_295046_g790_i0NODE_992_length_2320_cov_21_295046_g790_i0_p1_ORF_typecomplete_len344_score58_93CRM1_C/PF08767_11/3_8e64GnRH/PF00446_17/0_058TTRAP/PF14203_6/0_26_NODE_992_length_2320_cov_21_295046_g790_i0451034